MSRSASNRIPVTVLSPSLAASFASISSGVAVWGLVPSLERVCRRKSIGLDENDGSKRNRHDKEREA